MKERAVIYGLGGCWEDYWQEIAEDYEIVCCTDWNQDKGKKSKQYKFCRPEQIQDYEYDKLIICIYDMKAAIREEIILLWDLPIKKNYYYQELYQGYCGQPEKKCISSYCKLTVVIPTYNRKERLRKRYDC